MKNIIFVVFIWITLLSYGQDSYFSLSIKDIDHDGTKDSIWVDQLMSPKNASRYLKYKNGLNGDSIIISSYSLSRYYLVDYYDIKCDTFDNTIVNRLIPYLFDSEKNIKVDSVFRYKSKYLDFRDSIINEIEVSLVKQISFNYKKNLEYLSEFAISDNKLVHFWKDKINISDFELIAKKGNIEYYEFKGCSYIKNGENYSWLCLDANINFWHSGNWLIEYKPKAYIIKDFIFAKSRGQYGEFIKLINLSTGKAYSIDTKDFKSFSIRHNKLIVKTYSDNEHIVKLSDLFKCLRIFNKPK